ncbi:LysR family transcriptional regulator [Aestuariicella hydrocarbonica]|uniref:LysR family transcriptional regulator n=1 Tax=Pseudomaricurvus hydrocarbonicus TaxID=1470433 RepID=A0A9E5MMD0_9GAMM|nr:LysR family transcriptional regulator [Aestuariicella hydrocarbonica]NHO66005.1 LysR family transcriptional regulator [Aestuariicella hydrocarbonica]
MANLRSLDLNLLKAFDALMEERSVTRAAERLALTQPAVSGMLARLRENFDDPLFIRSRHGIVPTVRAEHMAVQVKRVLDDIHALLQPPQFDPAQAELQISIAATDYIQATVVVPFLRQLRALAPGIRVALLPLKDDQVQSQLEQGQLDMAFMSIDSAPADLHSHELGAEDYVCAMREGHPMATQRSLSLDQFCALDHAFGSYEGGNFRGPTDDALARIGRERRVVLSVPNFLLLPDILRATDVIAVVPRRLVAVAQGLALTEPPLHIAGFTKVLSWHPRSQHDPGHRWLRELIINSCLD